MKKKRVISAIIRLDPGLKARCESLAEKEMRSFNSLVLLALSEYLRNHEHERPA